MNLMPTYHASKRLLFNMTHALEQDGVDFHVLCPGFVSTSLIHNVEESWVIGVSSAEDMAAASINMWGKGDVWITGTFKH
jgi:short-subunit dehydrogenase